MNGFRSWWHQPDHYDWLSSYLRARGLITVSRRILFGVLLTIAAAMALTLASPSGPREPVPRTVATGVVVTTAAIAVFYLFRWPTRLQSQIFSVAGTLCIAAGLLSAADPRTAMVGCATFAGLAGYVAFFHSATYLTVTLSTGVLTAAVCALRIARAGDATIAIAMYLLLCGGILAVPVCGQALVHWLSVDSRKSSTDALTGLRNRRGLYRWAQELSAKIATDAAAPRLSAILIDLDGFKRLNDTLGHSTGDAILVAVADSLRQACPDDAAIARIGGEEFVVAQLSSVDLARAAAERVRLAVASTPWGVTASLGLAAGTVAPGERDMPRLMDLLVEAADAAMYEAKRAGGNQLRESGHVVF